jgi:hypothetical protein
VDIGKGKDDESDDEDRDATPLREEVERKYYPERYKFWPFGDPFIEKRKLMERRKRKANPSRPTWNERGW